MKLTLTSRRLIRNHIDRVGDVTKVPMSKELLRSVSFARRRYRLHLEMKSKRQADYESERKRKLRDEEHASITLKKQRIEKDIAALLKVCTLNL